MSDSEAVLPALGLKISTQALVGSGGDQVFRETVTIGDGGNYLGVQSVKPGAVQPSAADGAAVVCIRPDTTGSVGSDFSANAPAWPLVGANFGGGHPLYPSWVLLKTVAVSASRRAIEVWNMASEDVLVLRDDGAAANGQAPVNASALRLVHPQSWRSNTFRGRLQIYGVTNSDFVSIFAD